MGGNVEEGLAVTLLEELLQGCGLKPHVTVVQNRGTWVSCVWLLFLVAFLAVVQEEGRRREV